MTNKLFILLTLVVSSYLTGCASVPMGLIEDDTAIKKFSSPPQGTASLYIFRNTFPHSQDRFLKKAVFLNDKLIGKTLPNTYFYREIKPGNYKISTKASIGKNDLTIDVESGQSYFIHQYIKRGLLSASSDIKLVSEEEGRKGVLKGKLAK